MTMDTQARNPPEPSAPGVPRAEREDLPLSMTVVRPTLPGAVVLVFAVKSVAAEWVVVSGVDG